MQRIRVDLPEPDGPQMTIRSPRLTARLNVFQHVERAIPFVHLDNLDRDFVGDRGIDNAGGGSFSHDNPSSRGTRINRALRA